MALKRTPALVPRPGSSLTKAGETFEHLVSGLGPHKWLGVIVVELQVGADRMFEIARTAMDAAPQPLPQRLRLVANR